jgi:hypothetical protein
MWSLNQTTLCPYKALNKLKINLSGRMQTRQRPCRFKARYDVTKDGNAILDAVQSYLISPVHFRITHA